MGHKTDEARKLKAREMALDGMTYTEIGRATGTNYTTARRWCEDSYADRQRLSQRVGKANVGNAASDAIPYAVFLTQLGGEW